MGISCSSAVAASISDKEGLQVHLLNNMSFFFFLDMQVILIVGLVQLMLTNKWILQSRK